MDYLDTINFKVSKNDETTLLRLGLLLHTSLINADELSDVEFLTGIIVEYCQMASAYGEKTGRISESFAVDLNEARLMKLSLLMNSKANDEWSFYAARFKERLIVTARDYGISL